MVFLLSLPTTENNVSNYGQPMPSFTTLNKDLVWVYVTLMITALILGGTGYFFVSYFGLTLSNTGQRLVYASFAASVIGYIFAGIPAMRLARANLNSDDAIDAVGSDVKFFWILMILAYFASVGAFIAVRNGYLV